MLTAEIILGIVLAAGSFLLFADLSRHVISEEILLLDTSLSETVYSLRSPLLTQTFLFITFLGGSTWLLFASLVMFLFLILKKKTHAALLFLFTFSLGVALNLFIKYIVARARPDIEPMIDEIFYSYPSGHSMNAFVFYALLAYLTYHVGRNSMVSALVTFLCGILILAIGFSRIYLGVHYPSDVIAGFLAGCAWFLTVLVSHKTIQAYRSYQRAPRKKKI